MRGNSMDLKITGGIFNGRALCSVPNSNTRYTPHKVRAAIFSIINSMKDAGNSTFLDMCAGSGMIMFEAISRGFNFVEGVEISPKAIATIKSNIEILNVSKQIRLYKMDVIKYLMKSCSAYDVIFLDPPFDETISERIYTALDRNPEISKEDGIVLIERPARQREFVFENFTIKKEYSYGSIELLLYEKNGG